MEKTVIKLGDTEIEEQKLHQYKGPISIKNINIKKTLVCNNVSTCMHISSKTKCL